MPRRALVRGYFACAASHQGGGVYTGLLRGAPLRLHPNSVLYRAPPEWLLFHETVSTKHELMLSVTKVEERWLSELAPHFYTRERASAGAPRPVAGATMGEAAAGAKRRASEAGLGDGSGDGTGNLPAGRRGAMVSQSFAAMLGDSLAGRF